MPSPDALRPAILHTLVQRVGPWAKAAGMIAVFAYFAIAAAYTLPLTPLTVGLDPSLGTTMATYFPQSWHFFAPNEGRYNFLVMIRPLRSIRVPGRTSPILSPSGPWIDVSSPLWHQVRRYSLTGADVVGSLELGAAYYYMSTPAETRWANGSLRVAGSMSEHAAARPTSPAHGAGSASGCWPGSLPPTWRRSRPRHRAPWPHKSRSLEHRWLAQVAPVTRARPRVYSGVPPFRSTRQAPPLYVLTESPR